MKVAVMNFSGNVGKTTVAANLLAPRLKSPAVFSVESINVDASADGVDVEKVRGKQFGDLQAQLLELDDAVVDIGASNVEDFLKLMQQYHGSHAEFDFFVVPVVKERKQQADTVNTIRALSKIGVSPSKIRVVFNKVDLDDDLGHEFAPIFGLAATERSFTLNPAATIYSNEVFEQLKGVRRSLGDVATDSKDYRAELRGLTDEDERATCIRMIGIKQLAATANKNLDDVFTQLFQ
ncbi:StbB family protein (plasmid) [Sphaerotilaceae bacterium SBD11-9]